MTTSQDYGNLLNASIPGCLNAVISASKEGYNDGSIIADTNQPGTISLYLKPKHKLNINIKVIENGATRDLKSDESAIIQFSDSDDNYITVGDSNNPSINLIAGNYEINSYLTVINNGLVIPGSSVETCTDVPRSGVLGLIGLTDHKCFTNTLDSVQLDQLISGGDQFQMELDKDTLSKASQVTVYITKNPTPANVADLKDIPSQITKNSQSTGFILPELT